MSANAEKTREQIIAERLEKKKKKAALKNQSKEKGKGLFENNTVKNSVSSEKNSNASVGNSKNKETNVQQDNNVTKESNNSNLRRNKSDHYDGKKFNENDDIKSASVESEKEVISSSKNDSSNLKINPSSISECVGKEGKSKSQLKAERRAKQEADRAKKLQKLAAEAKDKKKTVIQPKETPLLVKFSKPAPVSAPLACHKVKLFAHLHDFLLDPESDDSSENVHPSVLQLRTQYSSRVVSGANACCLALLNSLKKVVMDFETLPNQEFSRGLESEITKSIFYLSKYRPIAVSMMNAVKHLKFKINQSKGNEIECKNSINEWIDTYIKEQLEMAAKAICLFVREKITCGDVILTYGWSSLIYQILISAFNDGIKFRVIVVDGRPWLEGRELLKKLVAAGIQCTYVFVNGLSYVMPEVTKILLGAHALLANGYVMSRVGSSQVALLAKTYNVPVLVCCETHKFSEKVQTDSFVYNELGNPNDLASNRGCISKELSKWKTNQYLTPLNLMYDVTPPDLVSAVVTEIAVLPCTSVPVILRIKPPDAF